MPTPVRPMLPKPCRLTWYAIGALVWCLITVTLFLLDLLAGVDRSILGLPLAVLMVVAVVFTLVFENDDKVKAYIYQPFPKPAGLARLAARFQALITKSLLFGGIVFLVYIAFTGPEMTRVDAAVLAIALAAIVTHLYRRP